jgi:hypothetical protein
MANWEQKLKEAFESNKEDFSQMVCTLSKEERLIEFDDGWGGAEGAPFTAWGDKYVYFPICYDGSEWVGCAPRNPCNEAMSHQGGG